MADAYAVSSHIEQIQEDGIIAALHAVFHKASVALQPSNRASKPTVSGPSENVNKRALAQGILLLIDRAGSLTTSNPALRQDVTAKVGTALRQQPWMWDLFIKRHLSDLLQLPHACDILFQSLSWLDDTTEARALATLCSHLRTGPPLQPSPAALVKAHDAALSHVRRRVTIVSHDLPEMAAIDGGGSNTAGLLDQKSSVGGGYSRGQVCVTAAPQLPAALQLMLWLGSREGSVQGGSAMASAAGQSTSGSGIGGGGGLMNDHINTATTTTAAGLQSDAGVAYAGLLAEQVASVDSLYKMLGLQQSDVVLKNKNPSLSSSKNQTANTTTTSHIARLTEKQAIQIKSVQDIISVLVEAMVSFPSVAAVVANKLHKGAGGSWVPPGSNNNYNTLGNVQSAVDDVARAEMVQTVACMMAVRWELAQFLDAAGPGMKLSSKLFHAPWLPSTCLNFLDLAVNRPTAAPTQAGRGEKSSKSINTTSSTSLAAKASSTTLLISPAILSHTLEHITLALKASSTSSSASSHKSITNDSSSAVKGVAECAAAIYTACCTGLSHPHAVLQGGAHREAIAAATQLRTLLTSAPVLDNTRQVGSKHVVGTKRQHEANKSAQQRAVKKERKQGETPGNAVDELLRLLTDAPQATAATMLTGNTRDDDIKTNSTLMGNLPQEEAAPSSVYDEQRSQAQPKAAAAAKKKKRIVPETIAAGPSTAGIAAIGGGLSSGMAGSTAVAPPIEEQEDEDRLNQVLLDDDGEHTTEREDKDGSWCVGRVLMTSTANMDDAAREALWSAYIEDKERLVEMLGDTDYQRWYDEDAHPMRQPLHAGGDIDAAFNAVFGSSKDPSGSSLGGPSLPRTILETSVLQPWQAGLAASLKLMQQALMMMNQDDVEGLVSEEDRAQAAAAALKVLDPNHSRNTWLGASKAARNCVEAGCLLRFAVGLHSLVHRASRRTAPVVLTAYCQLMTTLLGITEQKQNPAVSTTLPLNQAQQQQSKQHLHPLYFASGLVRAVNRCPPLLAATLTPTSAAALIPLSTAGMLNEDCLPYTASLAWLLLHPAANRGAALWPAWLRSLAPDAATHPVIKAPKACISAAVLELLKAASKALQLYIDEEESHVVGQDARVIQQQNSNADNLNTDDSVLFHVLPAMDTVRAGVLRLQAEIHDRDEAERTKRLAEATGNASKLEKNPDNLASLPKQQELLLHKAGLVELIVLGITTCKATQTLTDRLATALDGSLTLSTAGVETYAAALAVSLEFIDCLSSLSSYSSSVAAAGGGGGIPAQQIQQLQAAIEQLDASQQTCLELLRSLSEGSPLYVAAVRGMDGAPMLVGVAPTTNAPAAGVENDARTGEEEDLSANPAGASPPEGHAVQDHRPRDFGQQQSSQRKRAKRLREIQNPYLRAIVAEGRGGRGDVSDGDLSDLEDFIVTRPDRDYGAFISNHFPMPEEDDEGDEDEEDSDDDEDDEDPGGGELVDGDEVVGAAE